MDKTIIDKLITFGLITNVGVNANDYKDVDDLIAKGVITIPGARAKIAELLNPTNPPLILVEKTDDEPQVIETTVDTPVVNDTIETTEPEIIVEETVEQPKKKSKKTENN